MQKAVYGFRESKFVLHQPDGIDIFRTRRHVLYALDARHFYIALWARSCFSKTPLLFLRFVVNYDLVYVSNVQRYKNQSEIAVKESESWS